MPNSTEFLIENDCTSDISIWVEPWAHPVPLSPGEEIVVRDVYRKSSVTVRVSTDDAGSPMLSIWPGDGDTVVTKNGQDVVDWLRTRSAQ